MLLKRRCENLCVRKQPKKGNKFQDQVIVFSGFRDGILKENIEKEGGKVSESVSKKTTLLIVKEDSSSSKIKKAKDLDILIITRTEFITNF